MTLIGMVAAPASAATGGALAGGEPVAAPAPAPAAAKPALPHAPITSRSSRLTYNGPVYEKTPTGEVVPYAPPAPLGQISSTTGGSSVAAGVVTNAKPLLLVPGTRARYVKGLAAAPMSAPLGVQEIIWTANQIIGLPYIFGGGHASFESPGYDCSGTVSFALHGALLLKVPKDSSEFESYGSHGIGRWVTVFSNPGHAYMDVAGLRLDTSAADDPTNQQGPRWRPLRRANGGYVLRHPTGY